MVINMDKPSRKQNRLPDYDYTQEGAYFVTLCTHNRARLFAIENPYVGNDLCVVPQISGPTQGTARRPFSTAGNQIIHKWVREVENKFPNVVIDKYVVMSDHLHLIVSIMHLIVSIKERHAGRSLPDVMRFFKTMTTNEYIRGVKNGELQPFEGKLWQKSYYDHVIRNQQDYNEIWEYVENNPTQWMLLHNSK